MFKKKKLLIEMKFIKIRKKIWLINKVSDILIVDWYWLIYYLKIFFNLKFMFFMEWNFFLECVGNGLIF